MGSLAQLQRRLFPRQLRHQIMGQEGDRDRAPGELALQGGHKQTTPLLNIQANECVQWVIVLSSSLLV